MLVHAILNKQREKVKTYNIYSAYDKRYIHESKKGKMLEHIRKLETKEKLESWTIMNYANRNEELQWAFMKSYTDGKKQL